jgi:hypothetical protein
METTILIPARIRTEKDLTWLKLAIASAAGQAKIIIGLNNCNPDIPIKLNNSVLLEGKNLASIRNQLVRMVTTTYFFFLDHDDLIPADVINRLEQLHPKLAKHNEYLYGSTIMFGESSRLTIPAQPFDCEKLTRGVYFPNGVLQLTKNFERIGGWDEDLFILEDREWWIRAVEKDVCGLPVSFITYEYRQHGESLITKTRNTPEWQAAISYIKSKHKDFFNGGYETMCSGGCGKKKAITFKSSKKTTTQTSSKISNIPKILVEEDDMILLKYRLSTGGTVVYGPFTGKNYRVSKSSPFINVHIKDAQTFSNSRPGLLEMVKNNTHLFEKA